MALEETNLKIAGMHCAACSRRLEKVLGELPGVEQARVNLALEKAYLRYDPDRVSMERIHEAVQQAGYSVAPDRLHLSFTVTGLNCAACVQRVEKALGHIAGCRSPG